MTLGTLLQTRPVRARVSPRLDPDRLFDELRRGFFSPGVPARATQSEPRIEGVETETAYRVRAELPGYEESDFEVSVEDGVLSIKGTIPTFRWDASQDAEAQGDEPEAPRATFERRFRFGGPIEEDKVTAKYSNGVLMIDVPKPPAEAPPVRAIPVEVA